MKQIIYTFFLISIVQTVLAQTPPATWQEHWFEHEQLLNRKFYDNDVAVYYDNDVSTSVTWPYTYMGDVWRYTKNVYGSFGSDPHLFAIFHTNACLVANSFNDLTTSLKITATRLAATRTTTLTGAVADKQLIIYPNPVSNELRFYTTQSLAGATIRILDVMGREVLNTKYTTNTIDVTKLSSGVYTLLAISNDKMFTKRFVKQ